MYKRWLEKRLTGTWTKNMISEIITPPLVWFQERGKNSTYLAERLTGRGVSWVRTTRESGASADTPRSRLETAQIEGTEYSLSKDVHTRFCQVNRWLGLFNNKWLIQSYSRLLSVIAFERGSWKVNRTGVIEDLICVHQSQTVSYCWLRTRCKEKDIIRLWLISGKEPKAVVLGQEIEADLRK